MNTRINQAKNENLLLITSLLLVALPHFMRMPVLITLFCALVIAWRLLYEFKKLPYPGKFVQFLLLLLGIVSVLISYQTIVGRHAGTALLVLMLCLKLTELKIKRDAVVIIFLGYFLIITSFLFSQSIPIAFYMLLTVTLLTTTLVSFQHRAIAQLQHLKLATRMVLFSLPLATVLFVLFPRIPGPLWGLPEDAYNGKTGVSDTMSPGNVSRLANSTEVAFRVKFDDKIPAPGYRYWRGPVLWSYDGYTWSAPEKGRIRSNKINYTSYSNVLSYTITLEPHQQRWLFALDLPASLPDQASLTPELQLLSNKPINTVKRYRLQSHIHYKLTANYNLSPSLYLALPKEISPKARELVRQWLANGMSDQQLVNMALNYFVLNEFYYSRTAPLLFDDPVDEFLFETREGYCEHFSSAFTVLMRIAGIPARVVTGYYGGEMNPVGNYMIIRQSDAHAWSEVYLHDRGWVRIDPTSVIPPNRIKAEEDIVRIQPESTRAIIVKKDSLLSRSFKGFRNVLDSINNNWNQWIIGYNEKKQAALFGAFGIPKISWQGLSTILFIVMAVLLGMISLYIFRNRVQIDEVSKIYNHFCLKLAKAGFKKQQNETASQFAQRVSENLPDKKAVIIKITLAYNDLHYGRYTKKSLIQSLAENVKAFKV